MPLHPKQFTVNECWLAFRATPRPLPLADGPAHVFIIQDAASMFIFGNAFAPSHLESPSRADAAILLRKAWEQKREWPKKLLLPEPVAAENGFVAAAQANGLAVEVVAEHELSLYIEDVRGSYDELMNPTDSGDA